MTPTDILMPELTDQAENGVVTAWMVDEGGHCDSGQLVAEVQAIKVDDQIYAPHAGTVVDRVGINVGVATGEPICRIIPD